MEVIGIKTPVIKEGDNLPEIIIESIQKNNELKDGDVLVVASSVISTSKGYTQDLSEVKATDLAKELGKESGLEEKFVEVVIQEADKVLGTGENCILTLNNGILRMNSGVDSSNAPKNQVLLMPKDSDAEARELLDEIKSITGKEIGIIISDSHIQPLRLGTIGLAVGTAGIDAVMDCRGKKDIYENSLSMTFRAIADQLASASQLIMGETNKQNPVVLIRGAQVNFVDNGKNPKVPLSRDIYANLLKIDSA
ncbi:MAG: coenzyme F420-0:L-glutamate ligase [Hadesarchaea archaeon]|nr:coenzyme F420-0:L-glutamate ligase [Hadesarchaea archaeon]